MGFCGAIKQRLKHEEKTFHDELETEEEYKSRWRSIYIIYFTMFLVCLGISIVFSGLWPYLDKMDPTAGKAFMGYIVSAHPLGQMVFSPLAGWWCNKAGSIRMLVMTTLVIFALSNLLYSSLEIFTVGIKYWMLASRFIVGISAANMVALRTYLSAATKSSERRRAIAMFSLAQILGLIIGPAVQVAIVPLGSDGFWIIPSHLRVNMYTAGGWINIILTMGNIYLFLPSVFREHNIAAKEAHCKEGGSTSEKEKLSAPKSSAWILIALHFILIMNFMVMEALGTSIAMDHFAFTKAQAISFMGTLTAVGAGLSVLSYMTIDPLCRKFGEMNVMIWGGIFMMTLGHLCYIPMGAERPLTYDKDYRLQVLTNLTYCQNEVKANPIGWNITATDLGDMHRINSLCNYTEIVGCPSSQEWCFTTNAITLPQLIIGTVIAMISFPLGLALMFTLFSRILGTAPQGVWMGYMTSSGSLSRIVAPTLVAYVYTELGPNWTFGATFLILFSTTIYMWVYSDRFATPVTKKDAELQQLNEGNQIIVVHDTKADESVKLAESG